MANMRMLIRIVFVIFIANGIDCLGNVCDNCCDCFKEKDENEEIAISLVANLWYNAKKNNLVLKIFEKEENSNVFTSTDNKYKILIESEEKGNPKIACQNGPENKLKLEGKKYALFEIKTQEEGNTVYLYCSDVESIKCYHCFNGIFEGTTHISISVIACDTENVTDMWSMFFRCSSLEKLDLNNFDTTNVMIMKYMFCECRSLTELDLKNFNTTKVTDMEFMFYGCSNLKNLDISNFNTLKVTNMGSMFSGCSRLENLDISNFNTAKDTIMEWMFYNCSSLNVLKIGDNFYTTNDKYKKNMFIRCDKLLQDTKNKILGENK